MLERPEESTLPATAPDVLDARQESDAPTLARTNDAGTPSKPPTTSTKPDVLAPPPKVGPAPLPMPKRSSQNVISAFVNSVEATMLSNNANRRMNDARQAELKGDFKRSQTYKEQAYSLFEAAEGKRPEISSIDDVNDFTDIPQFAASLSGQALPSVATSILAGTAGGMLGRIAKPLFKAAPTLQRFIEPGAAFTASVGSQYPTVKGGIVASQEADPTIAAQPVEDREGAAMLTALGSSALEGVVPAGIGRISGAKLLGKLRKDVTPEEVLMTNKGNFIRNTLGEGATEVAQTLLEEISLDLQNPDRQNTAELNDYLDSFLGGIAGGVQGHAFGRGLEGLGTVISNGRTPDNAFGKGERGSISFEDVQRQPTPTEDLLRGTKGNNDVFEAVLPPDVVFGLRGLDMSMSELLSERGYNRLLNKVGEDRADKMVAAGLLAHVIENPNIESNQFQAIRSKAAEVLFPDLDTESGLTMVDSIFDAYQESTTTTNITQEISDTAQTSERNLEFNENLSLEPDQFGNPAGVSSLRIPDDQIRYIFNVRDQALRSSEGDSSIIKRASFNTSEFEMNGLNRELDEARANGADPSVIPVTQMLERDNIDPFAYTEGLIEDLNNRIKRNNQDDDPTATEKGLPRTQTEVRGSEAKQAETLSALVKAGDREALMSHLRQNYSVGSIDSIPISKELAVSDADLESMRMLSKRIHNKMAPEEIKAIRAMELTPLQRDPNGTPVEINGEVVKVSPLKPINAESAWRSMETKGSSRANTVETRTKRGEQNVRSMFNQAMGGILARDDIVGFQDPAQEGVALFMNNKGQVSIPNVPISRSPFKTVEYVRPERTTDGSFEKESIAKLKEPKEAFIKAFDNALQKYLKRNDALDLVNERTGFANIRENLLGSTDISDEDQQAIEYIENHQADLKRQLDNYKKDIETILNEVIRPNFKRMDQEINIRVELHNDRGPRTFKTAREASDFRNELKETRNALVSIKREVDSIVSEADENIVNSYLEQKSQKGALGDDVEATILDDAFDPSKKIRENTDEMPGADKVKPEQYFSPIPELNADRTPAGIPEARVGLASKPSVSKVSKNEQHARNIMRVFISDRNDLPTRSAGMSGLNDLQSTDMAYLLVDKVESVIDPKKTRSKYLNKLIKASANIYLAEGSFRGKNKDAQRTEFVNHLEKQGYAAHPTDANLFVATNNRLYQREQAAYDEAVKAYEQQQADIEGFLNDPESRERTQAEARYNAFGGKKPDTIGKKKTKPKIKGKAGTKAKTGTQTKAEVKGDPTLQDLVRAQLKQNRIDLEAAFDTLSDYGSDKARETFHAFIKSLDYSTDSQRVRNDLHRTIHGNRRVVAKMRELIKNDPKYKLDKTEFNRLKDDADYVTAFAFQMWANGDLQIGETALSRFKQIVEYFLNIVGITMSHQYGEQLFTAFKGGSLKSLSEAKTVYRQNQRALDQALRDVTLGADNLGRRVTRASIDVLRETRVPELVDLADLIQVAEVNDKNPNLGFIPSRKQKAGVFNTKLSAIAEKYSNEELEAGLKELIAGGALTTSAGRALRNLNNELYAYMEQGGVRVTDRNGKSHPIKTRMRRPPVVFSSTLINRDRTGFISAFKKAGLTEEQSEAILKAAMWSDGVLDLSDGEFDLGRPPNSAHLFSGLLDVVTNKNRKFFTKYEKTDPLETYYSFIRQAVHRTEFTKHFGHNGTAIYNALEVASARGLDKNQLAFIKDRSIPALLGTMAYNQDPRLRKLYGTILTVQNLAILPLALFASQVDIMGIPLRTGNMEDAWKAFKAGIQGLRNVKDDPDFNLAELIGVNDGQTLYDRIGDTYNELIDNPMLRKINQKFFIYNGLEGWTKGMRVAAMRAAITYLTDHRDNAKKLADIGLVKADLTFTPEGILDVKNNEKIQEAVYKFVDSAVLRPSSAHRPAWGSDPRFLLIWHLKQFTFTFHNVFYKRVAESVMRDGWKNATLIPYLSMIPVMMASDFARSIIAPSAHYESLTFAQTVLRGVQRSSMLGIHTFGFDILQDTKFDEFPGTSLLGPTFDSLTRFVEGDFSKALFRLTPGYVLTKAWVD